MGKFKYEMPSTLIRLYMGFYDYNMYMDSRDEKYIPSDGIISISSEI